MHYQNRQVIYMVRVTPAGTAQPQYPTGQPVPHSYNIHRASRYRTATISTGPAGTAQLQYPPGQPVPHSYNIHRASRYRTITISTGQPVCNRLVVIPATLNYRCFSSI